MHKIGLRATGLLAVLGLLGTGLLHCQADDSSYPANYDAGFDSAAPPADGSGGTDTGAGGGGGGTAGGGGGAAAGGGGGTAGGGGAAGGGGVDSGTDAPEDVATE